MAEGVIQWVDEADRVVRIIRRGHEYRAAIDQVEPHARRPGVRVHFDEHDEGGVPTASNVTLLEGTRRSRRQRRFGDLTGARRAGNKVETGAHARLGIDVETQPARVAHAWALAMTDDRPDDAVALYSPDVTFHVGAEVVHGSNHARAMVDQADIGRDQTPEVRIDDRFVQLDWPADEADVAFSTILLIRDGRIVEQWTDGASPEPGPDAADEPVVDVVRRGDVPDAAVRYGEEKIAGLFHLAHDSVFFTRLKLGRSANPAMETPVSVEATVDANGTIYRAHTTAHGYEEAIDIVVDKLRHRFERQADRERHKPTGTIAPPGEWHHSNLATERPPYFERPKEEREVVRHKSFVAEDLTLDEACFDMDQLDYDFFLFTELATGEDTLLHRDGEGLAVAQLTPHGDLDTSGLGEGVRVDRRRAPTLAVGDAVERLDNGGEAHVFFRNIATDRANVVYRRYDGHYGLITPGTSS